MTATLDNLAAQLWDSFPFSIVVTDYGDEPELRKVVYVNAAFSDLTGFTAEEVLGKPIETIEDCGRAAGRSAECEAALKKHKSYESTFFHYRKDGSNYLSRETVAPLLEQDGSIKFLVVLAMMISSIEPSPLGEDGPGTAIVGLTLPMPMLEYPFTSAPPHLASHPSLDALRELWDTIRNGRVLPRRDEFDLGTMKRWASQVSLATVTHEGRFRFRLFGTEVARLYGRDLTNCFLDELAPKDLWSVVIMHYLEVVKTRQPLFCPISISNGRWYNEVSRLLLPLADKDDTVAFIMAADYARLR
jgi:PAS domain S-box-containing protein